MGSGVHIGEVQKFHPAAGIDFFLFQSGDAPLIFGAVKVDESVEACHLLFPGAEYDFDLLQSFFFPGDGDFERIDRAGSLENKFVFLNALPLALRGFTHHDLRLNGTGFGVVDSYFHRQGAFVSFDVAAPDLSHKAAPCP